VWTVRSTFVVKRLSGPELRFVEPRSVGRLVIRMAVELHVQIGLRRMSPYELARFLPPWFKELNLGPIAQDRLDIFDVTRMVRGHSDLPVPLIPGASLSLPKRIPVRPARSSIRVTSVLPVK
jgi:hypothetical protein